MNTDKDMQKGEGLPPAYILILTHLLFIPLLVLAYVYYKERLFGDSAWYLFRVINKESFVIEHSRPTLYLWQWFIILLTKLGASMEVLLKAYSIFHVLFFYLAFILVVHVWKDFRSGLFILCFQYLGVSDMFFFVPMWEMWYGLIALIIQLSLWRRGFNSVPIHFILTLFILMSYPYNIILWILAITLVLPTGFIRAHIRSLFLFFLAGILLKVSWGNSYESQKVSGIFTQGLTNKLNDILNVGYWVVFFHFYLFRYTLVSFLVLLAVWVLRKEPVKLLFYLATMSGAVFIINVAFRANEFGSDGPTYEAVYYILPATTLLVLVYRFIDWQDRIHQAVVLAFIISICTIGTLDIIRVSDVYSERRLFIERTIAHARQIGESKVFYNDENIKRFNYHYCMFSIPMESLMLSSSDSKGAVTVAEEHMLDSTISWYNLTRESYLMMNEQVHPIASLNNKYFSLQPQQYYFLNEKCKTYGVEGIIAGSASFSHDFNTDCVRHIVYHVTAALPADMVICSGDTTIHWQVGADADKQPLSADARSTVDDYVIVSPVSLRSGNNNYIYLMSGDTAILKAPIK